MNKRILLGLFLITTSGLYASEAAQFEREQREARERAAAIEDDLDVIKTRDEVRPKSQEILSCDCRVSLEKAALLPTDIQERIWSFATDSKKRYVGNHMEQLIPAVIDWVGNESLFDRITSYKRGKVTLDEVNRQRAVEDLPLITQLPADKLYYIGFQSWEASHKAGQDMVLLSPRSIIVNREVMQNPRLSTERERIGFLSRNQFNALYYSNGSTLFKVPDVKRAELEQLSSGQLEYIVNLYQTRARNLAEHNSTEIHLAPEQVTMHKSLPSHMRVNLQNVYDLAEIKKEKAAAKRRKQCCTRLIYTSLVSLLLITGKHTVTFGGKETVLWDGHTLIS